MKTRQVAWDAKRCEIDQITDRLGRKIDKRIRETVVAFQMNGFNTVMSCQGHTDHGLLTPWVDIEAPDRPKLRFTGGVEARDQAQQNGETEEYQAWRVKTDRARNELELLLNEFYARRDVSKEMRLHITQIGDLGTWRVLAGSKNKARRGKSNRKLLRQRRAHMQRFTDFLKARYLFCA